MNEKPKCHWDALDIFCKDLHKNTPDCFQDDVGEISSLAQSGIYCAFQAMTEQLKAENGELRKYKDAVVGLDGKMAHKYPDGHWYVHRNGTGKTLLEAIKKSTDGS